MRARYLGDHDNFTAWEIRFPRGVFVPVTDPHAQGKIKNNREFEVENSDAEEVEFVETQRSEFASALLSVENAAASASIAAESSRQKRPYNRRK
jgi:hypothetical protein